MFSLLCLLAWSGIQNASEPAVVQFRIDTSRNRSPISPLIYGTNQPDWKTTARGLTLTRLGGNRWTAYNWETNASNAGSDYHHQNDGYLGGGETPGEAVRPAVAAALEADASIIVTVPMAGYVSADKNGDGDVNKTLDYLNKRFYKSLPHKGSPFAYPPDLQDKVVYEDEFVHWLEQTFPPARRQSGASIFYSLDNEPDLWSSTHARIHPDKLTYRELLTRSIDYADAIKAVAPHTLIFGPASYGWYGYLTLQDAPDRNGRDFLETYLAAMKEAEKAHRKRLLDVLDVHWYPEAQGGGKRITEGGNAPEVVEARLQAPRSLWDPNYKEDSWIVQASLHAPIRLLPRLKEKIAAHYPGTKLAITEYNYGGGDHISGTLAEADALGIFGREGVFAAALWQLGADERFVYSGFALYRNYDGKGSHFGDTSVLAETNDSEKTSIYASVDRADPNRLVVVLLNKSNAPIASEITLTSGKGFRNAAVYRVEGSSPAVVPVQTLQIRANQRLTLILPALSASTLELRTLGAR